MKETDNPLAFLLGNTFRVMGKIIRNRFSEEGMPLSPDQFGVLHLIDQKEESVQSELAGIMDKDKSAVLRQLDVLENKGLIQRSPDGLDRRKKNLVMTSEGEEFLKKGKKIIDRIIEELVEDVPEKELKIFINVLVQIKNKADK